MNLPATEYNIKPYIYSSGRDPLALIPHHQQERHLAGKQL